ncbi:MAG: phosphodiesterase [Pseudomonadota bacterium]
MKKVLVLTDLHLKARGGTIIGLDPVTRFEEALQAATSAHPDAAAVILTGDLTHSGRVEEYEVLRDVLRTCPSPVHLMLGNHDNRATFRSVFPKHPVTPDGHVQQVIDLGGHRLILLDTFDDAPDPPHAGRLCDRRLAWLKAALDGADGRQPVVFAHHPPMTVGIAGMDPIRLTNGETLLSLLAPTSAHLVCGHLHRTVSGVARGVPFTIFKSTCHQGLLDLDDPDSTLSVAEPAAYGLLLLTPGQVIAHSEDIGLGIVGASDQDALPEV